jgi:hypothetical protein
MPNAREAATILAAAMREQVSIDMARADETSRETRPLAGLGRPTIATA